MLAIRMQRVGRKGHAQFRVIIQDSHRSPSTGKIVSYAGSYNPHTKQANLDKEIIEKFLSNGAQPSQRVALLLKKEGFKLPKWVKIEKSAKRAVKNPEKLRKNQPKEKPAPEQKAKDEASAEKAETSEKPTEESKEPAEAKEAEQSKEPEKSEEPAPTESEEKPAKEETTPSPEKKEAKTE